MAQVKRVSRKKRSDLFSAIKKSTSPIMQKHKTLRDQVTKTWGKTDKPKFVPTITLEGQTIFWRVKVDAPAAQSASVSVWRLLNDGTEVMRAVMTPGFIRKTTVGQFTSQKGFGGMAYYSKDIDNPGIDAGGWDEKANETLEPEMREAIKIGIRNSNRS